MCTLWVGAPACPSALVAKQRTTATELKTESVRFIPIFANDLAFLTHDPETEVKVFVVLGKMRAERYARQPGPIVVEGPAAHSPPSLTAVGPLGIGHRTLRVISRVVPILDPFGDIAAHIVEAPGIGLLICDGLRLRDVVPSPVVRRRITAERVRHDRAGKLFR